MHPMKTGRPLALLSLFVLGACAKPSEADCEKMADHVTDIMVKEMADGMDDSIKDAIREEATKERDNLVKDCRKESKAWVDCVLKAQSLEEIESC
jgi:hypothetical protein